MFHDTSGNTGSDITQTSSYPGGGTAPATRPDAATTIVTRRGAAGGPSTTLTPGYDAAGNTTSRAVTATSGTNPPAGPPAESSISYDPAGLTAKVTTSGGTSGYTYDASGSLLVQSGPSGSTVYLDGGAEQLTYSTASGKVTAQRFYPAPDGTVIVRSYDNGTQATAITDETATPQGTAGEAVSAATQAITRRYFDPYGAPAGTVPPSWPDNHGYLGRPADPGTSLDLLGARQYDPTAGRFLSLDPVFRAGDPLAMGGYAYAGNDPASSADPTGLTLELTGGGGGSTCTSDPSASGCNGNTGGGSTGSGYTGGGPGGGGTGGGTASGGGGCGFLGLTCVGHFMTDAARGAVNVGKGIIGGFTQPFRDAGACFHGDAGSCGNTAEFLLMAPGYAVQQAVIGALGTGQAVYHEFAAGHAGEAIGTIITIAAIAYLTKRVWLAKRGSGPYGCRPRRSPPGSRPGLGSQRMGAGPCWSMSSPPVSSGAGRRRGGQPGPADRTVMRPEHFASSLVVPVLDERGAVSECRRPGASQSWRGLATGAGHAETSILKYMDENEIDPLSIAAGRPVCRACAAVIEGRRVARKTVDNYFPVKAARIFDQGDALLAGLLAAVRYGSAGESALSAVRPSGLVWIDASTLVGSCRRWYLSTSAGTMRPWRLTSRTRRPNAWPARLPR